MSFEDPSRPLDDGRTIEDSALDHIEGGWKIPDPTKKKKLTCPHCGMRLSIPVSVMTCPFCHRALKKG